MRKKILLFHDRDKFAKIFIEYVKENYFDTIDIYCSDNEEYGLSVEADIFLIQEKYKDLFYEVWDDKKYILSGSYSNEDETAGRVIYKYTPVNQIISLIMGNEDSHDEVSIILLASYGGGAGKSSILNAADSFAVKGEMSLISLSFDFFEKYKASGKKSFMDQLVYYTYQGKDIPHRFTDEIKEGIYKYGLSSFIFGGNPRDFEKLDIKHIKSIISYFCVNIRPNYLFIEWPDILLKNSSEILDMADRIIFAVDYGHINQFEKFLNYYYSEYKSAKSKTIFLINKCKKNEFKHKNVFNIPYFDEINREEEFGECLKAILKNQLMT